MALQNYILGPVPIPILLRRLQIRTVVAVQVGEYPVMILQPAMTVYRGLVLLDGREGAGGRTLGPERAGGEIGERGRRRSGRSRYHDCRWPNGCWGVRRGEGRAKVRLRLESAGEAAMIIHLCAAADWRTSGT